MFVWAHTRTIPGPELTFACPACGCQDAAARTFQYGERAAVLIAAPVSPYTETNYVKCCNCGELFVSKLSVFSLPGRSTDELNVLLKRRVPLVALTLPVCGILLFFVPVIGLGVNVIALLLNWRHRNYWSRSVSWIGTLLALPFTVLGCAFLVLGLMAGR